MADPETEDRPAARPLLVVDPEVARVSPAGSLIHEVLRSSSLDRAVTIVSTNVDPPIPAAHVSRARSLPRPQVLRFISFRLSATLRSRRALGRRRDPATRPLLQVTEGAVRRSDLCYAHFCHRAYLQDAWASSRPSGARRLVRWSDHALRAWAERVTFDRTSLIVVPSVGLQRELARVYPTTEGRVRVIRNPVDVDRFSRPRIDDETHPTHGDRPLRACFVALGHFERKGLPIVLEALATPGAAAVELDVVGGEPDTVNQFTALARQLGVADRVRFHGLQEDIRSYLWASDLLVLPTAYEAFPLVVLQAAAASLPIVATRVSGIEDLIEGGAGVIPVERTVESVAEALESMAAMEPAGRTALGEASRRSVESYRVESFVEEWRLLYRELDAG